MSATIFSGSKIKALKAALQLGNEATIYSGSIDPSSAGFVANQGDVYISTSTNSFYQKTGSGDSAWSVFPTAADLAAKANVTLNNLTTTALSVDLLPVDVGYSSLGSAAKAMDGVWCDRVNTTSVHFWGYNGSNVLNQPGGSVDGSPDSGIGISTPSGSDLPITIFPDGDLELISNNELVFKGTVVSLNPELPAIKITNLATPTDGADAANKDYVDTKQVTGSYITALTGDGTATGPGSVGFTLATVNSAGTYTKVVTNVKGLVTSGGSLIASDMPSGIDAVKIADGSVSNTEYQYLDGVTGAIQTQINTKQATGNYITALTGDISATGPGSVAATIGNLKVTNAMIANTTIDLTAKVTGLLPLANGGTNANLTASNGAVPYSTGSAIALLAPGTSQNWMLSGGAGAPSFSNTTTTGKTVDGTADEVQVQVEGHSTQTSDILNVRKSDGTTSLLQVTNVNGTKIRGTTTNDNAAAGFVGEYISSTAASQNFPSTGTYGDGVNISLTAGDWDVSAILLAGVASGSGTIRTFFGISTTSGNSGSGLVNGDNQFEMLPPTAAANSSGSIPAYRMSVSGNTTVYLKVNSVWSIINPIYSCRLSARRIR